MSFKAYFNIHNWIEVFLNSKLSDFLSDRTFGEILYWNKEHKVLHLDNPILLNEKFQWLKLYCRKPEMTVLADKVKVRDYIARTIGEEYLIPLIGVWDNPEEIDFSALPDRFVMKCNHNSGLGMCICKDKSLLDEKKVKHELRRGLHQDYYKFAREWPYKDIERKIICEQFLENDDGTPIVDYKFYCYGGKPRYFMYSVGEADHHVRNHKFDMDLNSIDYLFKKTPTIGVDEIHLPENMNEMISLVEILCKDYQHIRVDLYNVNGRIYFGELTFFTSAGIIHIDNQEYAQSLADLIKIR